MNTSDPDCGLDIALTVMGGKWKPLILYHLHHGTRRFGDLKRLVSGISEPPRVDYTVTLFGVTLVEALMPLCHWGTQNRSAIIHLLDASSPKASLSAHQESDA